MSRNLRVRRFIGLMLVGILGVSDDVLLAQEGANVDPGIVPSQQRFERQPSEQQAGGQQAAGQRLDRTRLTQPDLRAGGVDPNTGTPIDPRVEALLEEWSQRTKEIKRLQGTHVRATRDFTFGTESWAEGQFYVETPDKGRIDVKPWSGKMPKSLSRVGPNGVAVPLTIQRDSAHDRWVCDGNEIKAIDDDKKNYEVVKIPPSQRGDNIMDGPLPFLFGMPPEKAKARYQFKILAENEKAYAIQVRPNWKQDAVDWVRAELLLDRKTCLPKEVHLHNPADTRETVYVFSNLDVNRIRIFFWSNPFDPNLAFYTRAVHNGPPASGADADPIRANKMPSLVGLPYKNVKTVKQELEKRGFKVQLKRGDHATRSELVYVVEYQEPARGAPLDANSPITLTLYDKVDPKQAQQNATPINRAEPAGNGTRTVAKPTDP